MSCGRESRLDEKILSLVRGYLEKAEEKLRVAEELLKSEHWDDAVSRAYYSAFHAAQAVLLTEGLTADTHQGLVNLFGLHLVKTGKLEKKFGKCLANLKDECENGDDEIYSAIDQETATPAVREAKEFLTEMKRYLRRFG